MIYQQKTKRADFIGILLLITGMLLLQGVTLVEGRVSNQTVDDKPAASLFLAEVRVEEVPVLRAESEHFILEWMEREVASEEERGETVTGLASQPDLPKAYSLSQNYPNPFNPSTTISFEIPEREDATQNVVLTIYDVRGRQVRMLIDQDLEPGRHTIAWNGRDDRGAKVASGIYLYTLLAGDRRFTRKMSILK